ELTLFPYTTLFRSLDLAAGQGPRLAIEREIAEADLRKVGESGADFAEEQPGRLVEGRRQVQTRKELARAIDRKQHQIVQGQPGHPREGGVVEPDAARAKAQPGLEHALAVFACSQPPEQRIGLEPRAAACSAARVAAVLRQQYPDVHLVRLGLEPGEEPFDAVPSPRPGALPALPLGLAFQHPS